MELREFVSTSINEIITAIVMAQRYAAEKNIHAEIAPRDPAYSQQALPKLKIYENQERAIITEIQFDVAVTVSDEQSAKAGAGIKVIGIDLRLGADAAKTATTSAISRLTFSVPVILPAQEQHTVARI